MTQTVALILLELAERLMQHRISQQQYQQAVQQLQAAAKDPARLQALLGKGKP